MSDPIPLLRRREASGYLHDLGIPIAPPTLAKLACIGGGPRFRKFGRTVLYDKADLDAWVEQRLTSARTSTSDLGADAQVRGGRARG